MSKNRTESSMQSIADKTGANATLVHFRKSNPRTVATASGDAAKFLSYTEAWARIREARKDGFFLEAVTVQESIISDRLTSFVVKTCGCDPNSKSLRTLHSLGNVWVQASESRLPRSAESRLSIYELHLRLNEWRESRNEVVHGLVKSRAARDADHIDNFLARAKTAAEEGALLARKITRWVEAARRDIRADSAVQCDISKLSEAIPEKPRQPMRGRKK